MNSEDEGDAEDDDGLKGLGLDVRTKADLVHAVTALE
jgi:hypothetical protein